MTEIRPRLSSLSTALVLGLIGQEARSSRILKAAGVIDLF